MYGYGYGYYGFDIYYLILIVPCIILAAWAQMMVSTTFNRNSHVMTKRNLTGAQAAEQVLRQNGVYDVRIEYVSGKLNDHYDPRTNVIRLSSEVYGSTSVAAVGVAAHEAGHAVQYATGYAPVKLRMGILPICNLGSSLAWPLLFIGLILNSNTLFLFGIIFFAAATLFQVVTLPVELNASSRALKALEGGRLLDEYELPLAKKTLRAAAMTYVAALAVSLAQLLRLVLIFGGRRRDD